MATRLTAAALARAQLDGGAGRDAHQMKVFLYQIDTMRTEVETQLRALRALRGRPMQGDPSLAAAVLERTRALIAKAPVEARPPPPPSEARDAATSLGTSSGLCCRSSSIVTMVVPCAMRMPSSVAGCCP